jgi:hypothetical protein
MSAFVLVQSQPRSTPCTVRPQQHMVGRPVPGLPGSRFVRTDRCIAGRVAAMKTAAICSKHYQGVGDIANRHVHRTSYLQKESTCSRHCVRCTSWDVSDSAGAALFISGSRRLRVTLALASDCVVPAASCFSGTGATCRSLVRTRRSAPSADWVPRLSPLSRRLQWRGLSAARYWGGSVTCGADALPASPPAPRLFHISRPVELCMHTMADVVQTGRLCQVEVYHKASSLVSRRRAPSYRARAAGLGRQSFVVTSICKAQLARPWNSHEANSQHVATTNMSCAKT